MNMSGSLCSLTIDKAFPEDEGQYKCIAENTAGKAECACSVFVEESLKATEKKSKKTKSSILPVLATEIC
uniref:Uncharacterized protein n=1 Tax=Sphaerodactylus townsendi TaxID=933632 RepID=A0ACB8G185_9SAUR